MSKFRLCVLILLGTLLMFATAAMAGDLASARCAQLQAQFARHMQDLKQRHADEIKQCESSQGQHSDVCKDLKAQQKEELRQFKERQASELSGCRVNVLSFSDFGQTHYFHQVYRRTQDVYDERSPHPYYPHHPHR